MGGRSCCTGSHVLAIAAPRRVLAVAALLMVVAGVFRCAGGQEPVGGRVSGSLVGVVAGDAAAHRQVRTRATCS